jgi:hypothetical protein
MSQSCLQKGNRLRDGIRQRLGFEQQKIYKKGAKGEDFVHPRHFEEILW